MGPIVHITLSGIICALIAAGISFLVIGVELSRKRKLWLPSSKWKLIHLFLGPMSIAILVGLAAVVAQLPYYYLLSLDIEHDSGWGDIFNTYLCGEYKLRSIESPDSSGVIVYPDPNGRFEDGLEEASGVSRLNVHEGYIYGQRTGGWNEEPVMYFFQKCDGEDGGDFSTEQQLREWQNKTFKTKAPGLLTTGEYYNAYWEMHGGWDVYSIGLSSFLFLCFSSFLYLYIRFILKLPRL